MSYNKAMMAQLNKKIVLEMIRTQGPINKAEIARKAELSIPTVMKITEEFERQNLVKTIGKVSLQEEKDLIYWNLFQTLIT